jgi:glucose-6-phosphate dehydrogenase assembly protein OpcA
MVRPETILKELSKLWVDLGHEEQQGSADSAPGSGMLRACAMTLITIADDCAETENVGETVAMLMKEHPSRSVLIKLRATDDKLLDSRVFAQCWMPFGQRRQICCEQIEITTSIASLDDVPGVVLPLAVPDLPVILWNTCPRLFGTAAFPKIAAMSDKLIVDTGSYTDAAGALNLLSGALGGEVGGERLIADLAWVRVTRWRETVSQVFENRECMEALPKFTEAHVEYGGARPETGALYLAGWLQNGLKRAGSSIQVQLTPREGPALSGVTLSGSGGCDVTIRSDKSGSVEVKAHKLESRTIFPEATDYLALQEELSITTRDSAFEAALPAAKTLAAALAPKQ